MQKVKPYDNNGSFWTYNIDLLLIKSGMNPTAQKLGGLSYHVATTEAGVHEQRQLVLMWKLQLRAPSKSNCSLHLPQPLNSRGALAPTQIWTMLPKPISFQWRFQSCKALWNNPFQRKMFLLNCARHTEIQNTEKLSTVC